MPFQGTQGTQRLFFLIIFFIDLRLCGVFVAAPGLSLVVVSRGYSLVEMHRLLIVVASRFA